MYITDKYGLCSIEIDHVVDDSCGYDSFQFQVSIDIGHGLFKGKNIDVQCLNLPSFVDELDAFILDRSVRPRLEGTYDTFVELSGTTSSITLSFCIGDAYAGYKKVNTRFLLTGSFDVEQDLLSSILENFRGVLDSWSTCRQAEQGGSGIAPVIGGYPLLYVSSKMPGMKLVTAANGHLMLVFDGGWFSQLRLLAMLRFKHGFSREGRVVVGAGEAIVKNFVRGDVRLLASVEAGVGVTLLSESEESDAFLKEFASRA